MKALRFEKTGSLDGLRYVDVEQPRPGPGEALVRIHAAAINPSDAKNVLGKMRQTTLPRIPGRDFAGVVVEGPGGLAGREVFGSGGALGFGRDGSHAEFLAAPAAALVDKPAALSFAQAAALGIAHLTAWAGLVKAANFQPGETVLATGVTGAVGATVIRLAKWLKGGQAQGAARRLKEPPDGLPLDVCIDLLTDDLLGKVMANTDGRGVDVVFDVVGGPLFEPCLRCLAHGGRQVAISSPGDGQVNFNLRDFYHREARLFGADSLALGLEESAGILRSLLPGIESGWFQAPEIETCSLKDAPAAYRRIEEGTATKKLVIVFP